MTGIFIFNGKRSLRTEIDLLGKRQVPEDALYGIQTLRAVENFSLTGRKVNPALIHAYGAVKLACAQVNYHSGIWDEAVFNAISSACNEMINGSLDEHILVDALQGGAGTSTNMNINEVICNRALQLSGNHPGQYDIIHPIGDINLYQSTNDTYPTALRVAAILQIRKLEQELIGLLNAFQDKEKEFAHIVKIGRTQLQDAVLTTMGRTMGSYAEAISRDRWRVYKCEERLRVVNLGGTAIGTGLSAPRLFIFKAIEHLKKITGLGLSRAENMVEATQNTDVFVEVHGILNACATNLYKIANDLRLLASGPDAGLAEIILPVVQAGSTIMPGKVNPVIPETVLQGAITVQANGHKVEQACSNGNLELNALMPLIADALLESIDILINAAKIFREKCIKGLMVNEQTCRRQVENSTATITALIGKIGYEKAQEIILQKQQSQKSIRELVLENDLISESDFDFLTSAQAVNRLGEPEARDNK